MIWKRWTQNLGAKLLAVVCASVLWYLATDELPSVVERDFPVKYDNLPEDIIEVSELPKTVRARVEGKGRFLALLLRKAYCSVDLSGKAAGPDRLDFSRARIVIPGEEDPTSEILEPEEVDVEFDEKTTRKIAISPVVVGTPDHRFVQVGKTFVRPTDARVTGPRRIVDDITQVTTEPVDISGDKSNVRKEVRLVPPVPAPATLEVSPARVEVGITIEHRIERKIPEVALAAAALPEGLRAEFRPSTLEVELSGARSVVEVAAEEVISIALHGTKWAPGTTVLRLAEVRGPELVFDRAAAFPLGAEPAEDDAGAPGAAGAGEAGEDQVTARLPLPPGVEILDVKPRNIAVTIARAGAGSDAGPGGGDRAGGRSP